MNGQRANHAAPTEPSRATRNPFRVGDYVVGKLLGSGSFSHVFYCTDSKGRAYAIKILSRTQGDRVVDNILLREVAILQNLSHPNVIQLYDVMRSRHHLYMVLELNTGSNLGTVITRYGALPERRARKYFQQLIKGLMYVHSCGISHRDIKAENLLIDSNDKLRISDFGLATVAQELGLNWTQAGTFANVAPELFTQTGYSGFQADVWSCGCVLFYMLSGYYAFEGLSRDKTRDRIIAGACEPLPKHLSRDVRYLIRRLLTTNPMERITVEDIIVDPWFRIDYDP